MAIRLAACALGAAVIGGCTSPLDALYEPTRSVTQPGAAQPDSQPPSAFRETSSADVPAVPGLGESATPDEYIRYALYHSPAVEAAYQRWLAAAERLPQVGVLPDPRLSFGFFLDEVETRVGPQQARFGVTQAFPWFGTLEARESAAGRAAAAAWQRFQAEQLRVAEAVIDALHELSYLDSATGITEENLELLQSFEETVRARYRVGAGGHPELIRVQVELGQLEDRLAQLRAMRPAYVADLNAALGRESGAPVGPLERLSGRVVTVDAEALVEIARRSSPALLALDEEVEEQRFMTDVARKEGFPGLTVGLDYIVTDEAMNGSIPESGDDPILLHFGVNVPIWREKYQAGVREAMARRLSVAYEREDAGNAIAAQLHRVWFEHTDAHRRAQLYERTLIPKGEESLRASLAAFRAGEASFLDVLDAERTLLEFAIAAERARADRGQALATLNTLVGESAPTRAADESAGGQATEETQQ